MMDNVTSFPTPKTGKTGGPVNPPAMNSPYWALRANFRASGEKLSLEPAPSIISMSIVTDLRCDPFESVHDSYSERLALSPKDRLRMFAAKNSQDELALSPSFEKRPSLIPEEDEGCPPTSLDSVLRIETRTYELNRARRRQRSPSKKQEPLRVPRNSRVRKCSTAFRMSTQQVPRQEAGLNPLRQTPAVTSQDRATKLQARARKRSERSERAHRRSSIHEYVGPATRSSRIAPPQVKPKQK